MALVVVAVAARSQLDQRDASLLSAQRAIDDLTVANLALQDGVRELGEERERLLAQVAELEQRSAELGSALADTRRQLEQARQESSQQQSRAQSAEARSTALARVVQLDEEIHREFVLFLQEYDALYRALVRYDVLGAQAAYSRAKRAADRLLDLFDQRRAAMARL